MSIVYIILAVIAIGGVALVGLMTQGGGSTAGTITSSLSLDGFPSKGAASAPVTVVEYGDFQCPACGYFATTMEADFTRDYIDTGKVKFVFHDFPLSQHANAIVAAEAARCANDQQAFWPLHDLLYAKQAEWENSAQPIPQFITYAEQLKLDRGAFESCLNTHKYNSAIVQAQQDALKAGVNSTPTFTIDGRPYDYNGLRAAVDAALAGKK
jgi:protein-disulfide isomerase